MGPPASKEVVELTGLEEAMGVPAVPEAPRIPISAMPEEPEEATEHVKVCFKLPSGTQLKKRFRPDDPLEHMFAVASASTEQPQCSIELATQFPKRSLRDIDGGLQALVRDAGVAGNVVLVNVRPS